MSAILGLLSDRKLGSLDFQGLYAGNNSFDYYLVALIGWV
jgi:hypothetical protein